MGRVQDDAGGGDAEPVGLSGYGWGHQADCHWREEEGDRGTQPPPLEQIPPGRRISRCAQRLLLPLSAERIRNLPPAPAPYVPPAPAPYVPPAYVPPAYVPPPRRPTRIRDTTAPAVMHRAARLGSRAASASLGSPGTRQIWAQCASLGLETRCQPAQPTHRENQ